MSCLRTSFHRVQCQRLQWQELALTMEERCRGDHLRLLQTSLEAATEQWSQSGVRSETEDLMEERGRKGNSVCASSAPCGSRVRRSSLMADPADGAGVASVASAVLAAARATDLRSVIRVRVPDRPARGVQRITDRHPRNLSSLLNFLLQESTDTSPRLLHPITCFCL